MPEQTGEAEVVPLRLIDVEELAEASRRDRPGTAIHLLDAVAGMLARAWDEGYSAGVCAPANRALGLGNPANPYRSTSSTQEPRP